MLADTSTVHLWSSHAKALFGTLTMLLHEGTETSVKVQTSESNIFCLKLFVEGASNVFKGDELGREIAVIAFPALVALAADPLASLVDTAFIGQLGPVELAAVGVSIAVFNLVSKLLNFPVLNLTTSLVAEEDATDSKMVSEVELGNGSSGPSYHEEKNAFISIEDSQNSLEESITNKAISSMKETGGTGQKSLPAVTTALIVGSMLGFFELTVLTFGSGRILDVMGVTKSSNMRIPAEQYLGLRALGSPAVVVSLVVQGVFRGFKDTRTPLFATAFGNIVNMILVPILMFKFGYGVSGSAVATVISQYLIALILLVKLCGKVVLFSSRLGGLHFGAFIKNGSLLLARSAAAMLSLTLATSEAARQGAIPMAAHQICMQVWLATSLLSDAIALAGQAIIASALAKGNLELAKCAAFRILQIGLAFGIVLGLILGVGLSTFSRLFTSDQAVLRFLALGIPFVAATQPVNSLAFVFDGLHFDYGCTSSFRLHASCCARVGFYWRMARANDTDDIKTADWISEGRHSKWTLEVFEGFLNRVRKTQKLTMVQTCGFAEDWTSRVSPIDPRSPWSILGSSIPRHLSLIVTSSSHWVLNLLCTQL